MKTVKAVAPYIYDGGINFKHKPYEAWVKLGGQVAPAHYPPRWLHGLAFRYELPMVVKGLRSKVEGQSEARLRFVEPVSLYFDTFPDYCLYEIIPFFWDVWPQYFDKVFAWLRKHQVRTAIFTSSQVAEMVREQFPEMNVLHCPEGIDVENYMPSKPLKERTIDFLEYGRNIDKVVKYNFDGIKVVRGQKCGKNTLSKEELSNAILNSKIVAEYPKSWTNPEEAGEIETLTQRYWEGMVSGCVMIGHAPKELIDLIGYNPVIELDKNNPDGQLREIISNIEDYQDLVDRNRDSVTQCGDWGAIIRQVMRELAEIGYSI